MANYVARVRSPWSPEEAFAYLADLNNFANWDPDVKKVVQIKGDGPGLDAAYDVTVTGATLTYRVEQYEAPHKVLAKASNSLLTSVDVTTVEPQDGGCFVTYDAELTLNGPLGLTDAALQLTFNKIGDKAAAGMAKALDGHVV